MTSPRAISREKMLFTQPLASAASGSPSSQKMALGIATSGSSCHKPAIHMKYTLPIQLLSAISHPLTVDSLPHVRQAPLSPRFPHHQRHLRLLRELPGMVSRVARQRAAITRYTPNSAPNPALPVPHSPHDVVHNFPPDPC